MADEIYPILVKSEVLRCNACKTWITRAPAWHCGQLGKSWTCHICGCSSVQIQIGRPFGSRSKIWQALMDEFDDDIRRYIESEDSRDKEWASEWVVMPEDFE